MKLSATASGALLTPALLMLMVGNIAGGWFVTKLGRYKWVTITGLALMACGAFLLATINTTSSVIFVVTSQITTRALTQTIDQAYLFCAIVLTLVMIANLFLKEIPLRTANVSKEEKL